jgi:hypothetical protein
LQKKAFFIPYYLNNVKKGKYIFLIFVKKNVFYFYQRYRIVYDFKIHTSVLDFPNFFLLFVFICFLLQKLTHNVLDKIQVLQVCDIPITNGESIGYLLLGTPTAGELGAMMIYLGLNSAWSLNAQMIGQSGVYNYTYTVTEFPGCADNTAKWLQ